jgi:hypothetical protein
MHYSARGSFVRRIAEAVLVLVLILAIGQAKCAGVREGAIREQLKEEKSKAATYQKAAKLLLRRNDSLSATISTLNARLPKTITKYHTLRDTLLLQDSGVVPIADVIPVLQAADSVIALQGQVIEGLSQQNRLLFAVIEEKDKEIASLNRQISLATRQHKPPFLSRVASTTTKLAVGAVIGAVVWEGVR